MFKKRVSRGSQEGGKVRPHGEVQLVLYHLERCHPSLSLGRASGSLRFSPPCPEIDIKIWFTFPIIITRRGVLFAQNLSSRGFPWGQRTVRNSSILPFGYSSPNPRGSEAF